MVTAGVFLLARCSPILEYAPNTLIFITLMGGLTAFFAATTGLFQNDLKKVIAYSTCSQLGYMVFACGVSSYGVAIFHLATHAFFKALLFLGAGSVIHGVGDEQDMRKMGGLRRTLPFTYSMMLIGSLALMGFPFLAGFYSKDVILEVVYAKHNIVAHLAYWLGTFAAFFTAFYSIRLLFLTFLTETNGRRIIIENSAESGWKMLLPLAILAIPSIFVGFLAKDFFVGPGTDVWGTSLYINPFSFQFFDAEFLSLLYKLTPVIFSFLGFLSGYLIYLCNMKWLYELKLTTLGNFVYNFFNKKWFIDRFYNQFVGQVLLKQGFSFTYKSIDRGIIEIFGPYGIASQANKTSTKLIMLQTGNLYHYTFLFLIGCSLILFFLIVNKLLIPLTLLFLMIFILFI